MCKSCINGMTSVMALLFLQLSALFALYEMRQSIDEARNVKQEKLMMMRQSAALIAMRQLQHDILLHVSDCVVPAIAEHMILSKREAWWLQYACPYNLSQQTYYYILENMGSDSCAYTLNSANKQYVTPEYYRITLYADKIILQSTLAIPGSQRLSCASGSHQHEVYSGSQMTRLLTGLRNSPWHLN